MTKNTRSCGFLGVLGGFGVVVGGGGVGGGAGVGGGGGVGGPCVPFRSGVFATGHGVLFFCFF